MGNKNFGEFKRSIKRGAIPCKADAGSGQALPGQAAQANVKLHSQGWPWIPVPPASPSQVHHQAQLCRTLREQRAKRKTPRSNKRVYWHREKGPAKRWRWEKGHPRSHCLGDSGNLPCSEGLQFAVGLRHHPRHYSGPSGPFQFFSWTLRDTSHTCHPVYGLLRLCDELTAIC